MVASFETIAFIIFLFLHPGGGIAGDSPHSWAPRAVSMRTGLELAASILAGLVLEVREQLFEAVEGLVPPSREGSHLGAESFRMVRQSHDEGFHLISTCWRVSSLHRFLLSCPCSA